MKRFASAAFLFSLVFLPCACLHQQQQRSEAREEAARPRILPPLHLGAVHQVYPEQGFALLRIIGPMPEAGTTLITHPADGSNERIGNLSISPQRPSRDGIVAADIRSGTVVKGDRVFRYRNIAASSAEQSGDVIAQERPTGLAPEDNEVSPDSVPLPAPAEPEESASLPSGSDFTTVETTVLPTTAPAAPGSDPGAPSAPAQAPGYLDDIPDDIKDWDSL